MKYQVIIFLISITSGQSFRIRREDEDNSSDQVMCNSIVYHFGKNISEVLLLDSDQQSSFNSLAYVALHFHFTYDNNRDHFDDPTEFEDDYIDDFSDETNDNSDDGKYTTEVVAVSTPSSEVRAHEVILVNPNYHPWVSVVTLLDSIFEFPKNVLQKASGSITGFMGISSNSGK
ncbi:uncharacterized protein LOC130668639 [Microplitis mediator]|uniref:uncharacterized protein LOC130668639 n=1 Tax=Microplitis mediator TaxID=375433 RepID=UPI002554E47E|nr:uncharacterized protein LOC130668639 [Microplitis mediator]